MRERDRQRVAVVGASGFIGRALVARLRADGADVAAISRRGRAGGDATVTSYLNQNAVGEAIGDDRDALFHLAALAHRRGIDDDAFVRANVDGAVAVAEAAIARGVRRFVFVSSIGVLGDENSDGRPFDETTAPCPMAPYARSKWQAEQALRALLGPTKVELVIIRPPLVHGPGAPGNFGALAAMVRRPVPLPLGSVTGNRRSMVGIDNLVDFLVAASTHPAAFGDALLVSDGEDISTAELIARLLRRGGCARLMRFPPWLLAWLAHRVGKEGMARQLLGTLRIDAKASMRRLDWSPPLSLDEGLARAMGETS